MKILFCGESAGGSANYMLGLIHRAGAQSVHVASNQNLDPRILRTRFDAFIISDYPSKNASAIAQARIREQVEAGAGLLMVGGWGSFSGPFGKWKDNLVSELLPVRCSKSDDRWNIQQGAFPVLKGRHPILNSISLKQPPVLCGLNRFSPKAESQVLLSAQPIAVTSGKKFDLKTAGKEVPLLVVSKEGRRAALATDVAPHWCGGLVDWGKKRVFLKAGAKARLEVGDVYALWGAQLLRWLCGR